MGPLIYEYVLVILVWLDVVNGFLGLYECQTQLLVEITPCLLTGRI